MLSSITGFVNERGNGVWKEMKSSLKLSVYCEEATKQRQQREHIAGMPSYLSLLLLHPVASSYLCMCGCTVHDFPQNWNPEWFPGNLLLVQ